MKKKTRGYFYALLITSVTILILEGTARLLYQHITPERGRAAVGFTLGESLQAVGMKERRPYMLYIMRPGWTKHGVVQDNSLGHKGPEVSQEPSSGVLRILVMGGSTTYGAFVYLPSLAWPGQLEKVLSDRLQRPVEVINAGLGYGLSSEMLTHWVFRDRFLKPHLVILHTGGNDAATMLVASYKPDYSHFRNWEVKPLGVRPGERLLLKSYLVRVLYAWWFRQAGVASLVSEPMELASMTEEEAIRNARKNSPIGFTRNIDFLMRNILSQGAVPILFPYYVPQKEVFSMIKPGYTYAEKFYEAIKIGVQKNTNVMQTLARKHGTPMTSLSEGSIPLKYFVDHAHLNEEGHRIKASLLADQIIQIINRSVYGKAAAAGCGTTISSRGTRCPFGQPAGASIFTGKRAQAH